MNSHIEKLIVEDIDETFAIINYERFKKLIILKSNNYINVTKFVKAVSKKEFRYWRKLDGSQDLINELSKQVSKPIVDIVNVSNNLKGVYVHHKLLPSIISFLEPLVQLDLTDLLSFILNHLQSKHLRPKPNQDESQIAIERSSERIWSQKLIKWSHRNNLICYLQYAIESYRVDAFMETTSSIYLCEFDEKDHRAYKISYQLLRYRTILRIYRWLRKHIYFIRFSDSVRYSTKNISTVFDHLERIHSQCNIVYVNYSDRYCLKQLQDCIIYHITTDQTETPLNS